MSHVEGKLTRQADKIYIGAICLADLSCNVLSREENEEIAHRLVACWNACEGIPTEMLDAIPGGPVSLLPMYDRLSKERDELLKALRNGGTAKIESILSRYKKAK